MKIQTCALIGGMGSLAGLDVHRKVVLEAMRLGVHVPIVHIDMSVPDRLSALLHNNEDFVPSIVDGLRLAARAGATFAAIACNTAHLRLKEICAASPIPILNMVKETAKEMRTTCTGQRIAVLGTKATIEFGLYAKALAAQGLEVQSTPLQVADLTQEGINAIKRGDFLRGRECLANAISQLIVAPAVSRVIVLGCTEIPLVITESGWNGARIVDPSTILAKAIVREALASQCKGKKES